MKSKFKILIGSLCVCIAAFACVWAFTAGGLDFSSSGKTLFTQKADTPELTLVNADHAVPRGWNVELTTLSNGEQVASLIYPDLQEMFDDMRAQGIYPFVRAGYRSRETQEQVLEDRIASYQSEGYSKSRARELALETVAEPGTSEHELGLATRTPASAASPGRRPSPRFPAPRRGPGPSSPPRAGGACRSSCPHIRRAPAFSPLG